ncbi:Uma2 family endonuclease [Leptodesmis sichuanensis]|uniref:Uma2 family endonuclease n=1 Tax=Leptodesmis sichuanensis TaxID=2906798 RepID=UPI001F313B67|nr:Uma2 family endonuclease [Leptodesmis sichuanensis]UIE36166.1 Uma2 family endonuclease [Leptodesmis sichuanensis A121]
MSSPVLARSGMPATEQRLVLEGVSWQQYETMLAALGDDFPNLRLSYLEGILEIMTTSPEHEELKKVIGMLLEAYFQETRTRFHAFGSATFRKAMKLRGLEPDECYCLGQKKEIPDLAIEIVITSGIVNKLDIYQGLGVTEVWQWQDGQFLIHHLRPTGYEQITHSELLPNLDPQQLASYVNPTDQFDAVMAFRDKIRSLS